MLAVAIREVYTSSGPLSGIRSMAEAPSANADVAGPQTTATIDLQRRLERRVAELSILQEIAGALQSELDLERIARVVLVGATSHHGLSFNRAFLFLVDPEDRRIRGHAAIGPASAEEAARVWRELAAAGLGLRDLIARASPGEYNPLDAVVRALECPLDSDRFLARALRSGALVVRGGAEVATGRAVDSEILERLACRDFVTAPLVAHGESIGLLLADNGITGREIATAEVQLLELLAVQVSEAVYRTRLIGELAEHAAELERLGQQIHDNQSRLLRAERLSAIGQMSARLAHEIRNPLVVIGGFARSLYDGTPADDSRREALGIIMDEVRRLEAIVSAVLDYSKDRPPDLRPASLERIAEEAFDLLQYELDRSGIIGELVCDPEIPEALADRDQVFQALINLMSNSIHATPEGGRLKLLVAARAPWVEIAVEDTGTGIPEAHRDDVMKPFFTTKAAGTGLGLPIVAQIVRDHRGEMTIASSPGSGTTITLRFPAAAGPVHDDGAPDRHEEDVDVQDPDRRG